ncbi:hypothetical protein [Deinococcus soli (ex Cha et al. 2016)]|uniref:Uncharacterized protein n=2 Tax=Deinococcus soli (ex Cha et al. 2016) TaxID=1309411 RepID=A0AAE3XC37_9DEIO|nr:hypothetical protein [Deinococcus soli (ex Cha et al. 2016)]MDR6218296.1 hypothetical protein [Deinococcus soli (ex Cha et al. 2016)]MDR6329036.1 hypothetical protein [Deinococcus soli (ex Cha et al. 2016)]MDR6751309.1 hypothetical protein [Deinococcus soli (ex Cha et al. 2016)]
MNLGDLLALTEAYGLGTDTPVVVVTGPDEPQHWGPTVDVDLGTSDFDPDVIIISLPDVPSGPVTPAPALPTQGRVTLAARPRPVPARAEPSQRLKAAVLINLHDTHPRPAGAVLDSVRVSYSALVTDEAFGAALRALIASGEVTVQGRAALLRCAAPDETMRLRGANVHIMDLDAQFAWVRVEGWRCGQSARVSRARLPDGIEAGQAWLGLVNLAARYEEQLMFEHMTLPRLDRP